MHSNYNHTSSTTYPNGGPSRPVYNHSFKSQQPTQSSKAKQVTLPNGRKLKEQSYSLQINSDETDAFQQLQLSSQTSNQMPFPIQTYTKQQLEKMGITPSMFHNLPLMTQSEIQQHLKQQLKEEF